MSSHHIIRDEQEPALIIWEKFDCPLHIWHPILEWSPLLWVHHAEIDNAILIETKIDGILIPKSNDIGVREKRMYPLDYIYLQEEAIIDLADALAHKNSTSANLLINHQEKDKWINIIKSFDKDKKMDFGLLHKEGRTFFVKKGDFKKWYIKDSRFILDFIPVKTKNLIQISEYIWQNPNEGIVEIDCNAEYSSITEQW